MSGFIFMVLLAGLNGNILAQNGQFDPSDPAVNSLYSRIDFQGKFAVRITDAGRNNYFLADFTRLPGRFEKIWFMNLVHHDDIVVSADRDIAGERVWFMADRRYSDKEVTERMDELLKQTLDESSRMSAEEKESYLKKNDKYPKQP